jgi:hypothetical protein
MRMKTAFAPPIALFAMLLLWTSLPAMDQPTGQQPLSTRDIASLLNKATVTIKVLASDGSVRSGSGFIVDPSGTVVTNVHVVEGATKIEVHLTNGDVYEPSGVRVADTRRDIAVLQLAAFNLRTVKLADSDTIAAGDHVVVIGTALGVLENSVTTGVVSGIREVDGSRLFQMDAAVSPGNSGGPVANHHGEVIGITVAKLTGGQSLNFAIPINYARGELTLPVQLGLVALSTVTHTDTVAAASNAIPRKWKSPRSGTTKNIQISGDVMLVETGVPAEAASLGFKTWAELKKQGSAWVGTVHDRLQCKRGLQIKWCQLDAPFQITTITQSKIEGVTIPQGSKYSCRTCEFDRRVSPTDPFTWIPADH